jgi:hypothetical protein
MTDMMQKKMDGNKDMKKMGGWIKCNDLIIKNQQINFKNMLTIELRFPAKRRTFVI